MSRRVSAFHCILAITTLLTPVLLLLPVAVLGDEKEETAIHCTTASTTAPEPPTTYPVEGTELVITEGLLSFSSGNDALLVSANATVAMDSVSDDFGTGRILVAWDGKIGYNCGATAIFAAALNSDGTAICSPVFLSPPLANGNGTNQAYRPSAVLSASGGAFVAWEGLEAAQGAPASVAIISKSFSLDDFCSLGVPPPPGTSSYGYIDKEVSVGASDDDAIITWMRAHDTYDEEIPWGLLYGVENQEITQIRPCDPELGCWDQYWKPCAAMRSDGKSIIVWSDYEPEHGGFGYFFDIKLQCYDALGVPLIEEPLKVNVSVSVDFKTESSPAVAMDVPDESSESNIVVVWNGDHPDDCANRRHVYARRLTWDGVHTPVFASEQFIVDNDSSFSPAASNTVDYSHPTVALTSDPEHRGRWVATWNVADRVTYLNEVHAQYFEADGRAMGGEFRVNQAHETEDPVYHRELANSGAHTVAYGLTTAFAWSRGYTTVGNDFHPYDVYFTLLPEGYAEYQQSLAPCLKGDVNFDTYVNVSDITPFVTALLDGPPAGACSNIVDLCPYDMNGDGGFNGLDIQCFTLTILGQFCNPTLNLRGRDCNGNGVLDELDIENETSADANTNGIPDECEGDCNSNGIPDDKDIAEATSPDCNTNGIPDECEADCNSNGVPDDCDTDAGDPDGNELVSADCNQNHVPDECEQDCNSNGVPDSCDINPNDPDGDQWVSPDCNADGVPDECNLTMPAPFGSLDCNTNGIPDECDIASCESDPACGDCNSNGIPDACDIAAEISTDADTDGVPDECESEMMMMGGEGGEGDLSEQWEAFYDWSAEQCWGPSCETPMDAQFAAMVAKLQELGLPVKGHP